MKVINNVIWALGRLWGTSVSLKLILLLNKYYWNPFENKKKKALVLYSLDSEYYSCGFADRLRGMVSAYALSKALNIGFIIHHESPFKLEDFLLPNKYDWRIKEEDISFNMNNVRVYSSINLNKRIPSFNNPFSGQLHYYSNRDIVAEINNIYSTNYRFEELFNELFTPSSKLLKDLREDIAALGDNYVSISFRFVNLLGDFKEGRQKPLCEEDGCRLITKCIEIIDMVKSENEEISKVLVTADSMRFLEEAAKIDNVYIIPGKTTHSGHKGATNYEGTLKTFKDFILIAEAKRVYLGIVGEMYNSNFARTAAMTQGKEFEIIKR